MPREITLPEAKPALEWVNGRVIQKVSPKRQHAIAQGRFYTALDEWASKGGLGIVGTEWRFRVQPPGEQRRPLVPDVAYLSYARLPFETQQVTDEPKVAPDAVVEVLSPRDRRADVEEKTRVYLAAGTEVIFLVDPKRKLARVRDRYEERTVKEDGVITHDSLSGFKLEARRLFSVPPPAA